MCSLRRHITMAAALLAWAALSSCNNQPTDQGLTSGSKPPETAFAPLPLDGSMNNAFKLRLEWHGNDSDGIIQGYEYRIPSVTSSHFFFCFFGLKPHLAPIANCLQCKHSCFRVHSRTLASVEKPSPIYAPHLPSQQITVASLNLMSLMQACTISYSISISSSPSQGCHVATRPIGSILVVS